MLSIKDLVKGNVATFTRYLDGNLWYVVGEFEFPVPIEDTKGGVFLKEHKAIHLMRWIRQHREVIINGHNS